MDDSHQMVDIVGCTGSSHDATRTGRQTIYQTGRESNHQNAMLALTMIGNLFKLKGANKKFIHTEHGEHHK